MKRYIKSGRYIGDYYLSDAEEEEFKYYAEHPELFEDIEDKPIDRNKYPETYNFLDSKSKIQNAVDIANSKFWNNDTNWSAKIYKDSIKLYWDYFKYLGLDTPYVEITYACPEDAYSPWFNIIDPTGEDLTWKVEYNDDDIASMILGLVGYISNRW